MLKMVEDREQSKFASDVSYLNRINMLLAYADESAMSLDVFNWFHSLLAIFRELSTEMKPDEIVKFNSESIEINKLVMQYNINCKYSEPIVDSNLYNRLHLFEMNLRQVFSKAGLQLKRMDDAAKALR
jgi:hypothetical protein